MYKLGFSLKCKFWISRSRIELKFWIITNSSWYSSCQSADMNLSNKGLLERSGVWVTIVLVMVVEIVTPEVPKANSYTGARYFQYSGAKNVDVLANRENIEGRIICLNSFKQTFIRTWLSVAHICWALAWFLVSLMHCVF